MYDFIRFQYQMGKVTKEWVQRQVPRWITQAEADSIISDNEKG